MLKLGLEKCNEGHILIVPKEHYHDIDDLDDETLLRITKLSIKLTKVIKKAFNPDGYTIMQNGGIFTDFGHYHMHVFPRYIDDEFGWTCKEFDNKNNLDFVKEKLKVILEEL
ncbi:HIT family protein [Clostridium sp.]|uniref:HIT family protein n=1 Tax=Clostridium sp. TaxID=1506 RepID=UPI003D6D093B